MNFDLTAPCKNCPFRTDVVPYLRTARIQEIGHALTHLDQSFPCHKTTKHDDDGEYVPTSKEQHCAGALILLEKMEMPNQMMRIAYKRWYDPTKLDMTAPVYDSVTKMVAAYRKANRRTK